MSFRSGDHCKLWIVARTAASGAVYFSFSRSKVTFVVDTRNLKGKELVAFETAYRINDYKEGDDLSKHTLTQVAEHKDLNDEGQTVLVKDGPVVSPPPKTGDETMLWLYGILFTAAMGSMLALVIKADAQAGHGS